MDKVITSPSFPNGIGTFRSEDSVRAARSRSLEVAKPCPFCNSDPGLAVRQGGFWLVGCEADECAINPQAGSRESVADAWARWNKRG